MSGFGDILRAILRGEKSDDAIKGFLIGLNEAGLTSEQVRICLLYTSPSPRDS